MALIVSVAGCALPQAVDVSLQPHENSVQLELLVKHIHQKVNEHRASQNLAELKLDSKISRVARKIWHIIVGDPHLLPQPWNHGFEAKVIAMPSKGGINSLALVSQNPKKEDITSLNCLCCP